MVHVKWKPQLPYCPLLPSKCNYCGMLSSFEGMNAVSRPCVNFIRLGSPPFKQGLCDFTLMHSIGLPFLGINIIHMQAIIARSVLIC